MTIRPCKLKCCCFIVNANNDDNWDIDEQTGYVRFKEEQDYRQIVKHKKNVATKFHKYCKLCTKFANIYCNFEAMQAICFYIFILLFILSDLFMRVTPLIMFRVLLKVYFSNIIANISSILITIIILFVQCCIIYNVNFILALNCLYKLYEKLNKNEQQLTDVHGQSAPEMRIIKLQAKMYMII